MISLNHTQTVHLHRLEDDREKLGGIPSALNASLSQHWKIEEESETADGGAYRFKLRGKPFQAVKPYSELCARRLVLNTCKKLCSMGYELKRSLVFCSPETVGHTKSNLVFNSAPEASIMSNAQFDYVGIALNARKRLVRVFSTETVDALDSPLVATISAQVEAMWPPGMNEHKDDDESHDYRLKKHDKDTDRAEVDIDLRRLVCGLISAMIANRFEVLPAANADVRAEVALLLQFRRPRELRACTPRKSAPSVMCVSLHERRKIRMCATKWKVPYTVRSL